MSTMSLAPAVTPESSHEAVRPMRSSSFGLIGQ